MEADWNGTTRRKALVKVLDLPQLPASGSLAYCIKKRPTVGMMARDPNKLTPLERAVLIEKIFIW